jgi:S1-C subfamily serine protease
LLIAIALVSRESWSHQTLGGPIAIVKGDPPKHGFLGVEFGAAVDGLLRIEKVAKRNGTDHADLQSGDLIVKAGQTSHPDMAAIQRLLQGTVPGDEIPLIIRRGQIEIEVKVKLISFREVILLSEQERSNRSAP